MPPSSHPTGPRTGRAVRGLAGAIAAALVASIVVLVGPAGPASAGGPPFVDIDVETTVDVVDPADGLLSLREAVDQANADGQHSRINLQTDATYPLTICAGGTDEGANVGGDLDHTAVEILRIEGDGATIEQTCNGERVLQDFDPTDGIYLHDLTITGGRVTGSGGGLFAGGGASLDHVVVEGNVSSGPNGGGGVAANLWAEIDDSTIRNNAAGGRGGGVRTNEFLGITRSTITGNVSGDVGGGVSGGDEANLRSSTFSQNRALILGGGIHTVTDAELDGATVVANRAPSGANVATDELDLTGTIIALGSGGQDCDVPTLVHGGGSVGYDASCNGPGPDDLPIFHPMLAPLADNGGPTETMALVTGSPAFDRYADPCSHPHDQREVARPADAACDSGAYEGAPAACAQQFTDVPTEHPFFDEICWLAQTGITGGFGDGSFGAATPVSRQAMAAFLYRLALSPPRLPTGPSFSDVPTGHPFFEEIEWLNEMGITTGFPDGTFKPVDPVSRQAMAAFLYRIADEPPYAIPVISEFSDVPVTHPFYEAIHWMSHEDVSTGYEDGTWKPAVPVSRQAMAAFLQRMAEGVRLNAL